MTEPRAPMLTAADEEHLEAILARRLADPEDEGGPEEAMTSIGYVEIWKDGDVIYHGERIAVVG